jgi:hypothetical protein
VRRFVKTKYHKMSRGSPTRRIFCRDGFEEEVGREEVEEGVGEAALVGGGLEDPLRCRSAILERVVRVSSGKFEGDLHFDQNRSPRLLATASETSQRLS